MEKLTNEEIIKFLREIKKESEWSINLKFGLTNNCPSCRYYPCVCKELKEWLNKN